MKLLIALFLILVVAVVTYFYSARSSKRSKKAKRKINWRSLVIALIVAGVLLGFLGFQMYRDATAPDIQCSAVHATTSRPPANLQTAMDYFNQGNYDYDIGDCPQAIVDYTTAIKLDPSSPETFNNRAYTYMRMQNYWAALQDLDTAITLKPDYVQALRNRGDIHNSYYAIDRSSAIADYEKVVSLSGAQGSSVCGHLFLAKHNGWNIGTVLDLPRFMLSGCN